MDSKDLPDHSNPLPLFHFILCISEPLIAKLEQLYAFLSATFGSLTSLHRQANTQLAAIAELTLSVQELQAKTRALEAANGATEQGLQAKIQALEVANGATEQALQAEIQALQDAASRTNQALFYVCARLEEKLDSSISYTSKNKREILDGLLCLFDKQDEVAHSVRCVEGLGSKSDPMMEKMREGLEGLAEQLDAEDARAGVLTEALEKFVGSGARSSRLFGQ